MAILVVLSLVLMENKNVSSPLFGISLKFKEGIPSVYISNHNSQERRCDQVSFHHSILNIPLNQRFTSWSGGLAHV